MLLKKANTITTPTAYSNGFLHSVKPEVVENLLLYSNDFSQWLNLNTTETGGQSGYDGSNDAWKIVATAVNAVHRIVSNAVTGNSIQTFSVYAKAAEYDHIRIVENAITGDFVTFDLTNGLVKNNTGITDSAFIVSEGNGWYRCGFSVDTGATSRMDIYVMQDASTQIYLGDDVSGIYIQDAQVNKGLTAYPYLETTTEAKPSADFSFTRNSSATRVNELGYIEDVQIIGGELTSNGDFEEIGSEEVTNGSFDTNSNWSLLGTANISGGTANFPNTTNSFIIQGGVIHLSVKQYRLQYEVTATNGGNLQLAGGSSAFGVVSLPNTLGVHTVYITSNGLQSNLQFSNGANFIGSIDNVSVKEVGQDWTFGTGWSMSDGKAVCDGTNAVTISQSNVTTTGKKYRITYEIKDYVSGSVRYREGLINGATNSANGVYTEDIVVNSINFAIQSLSFIGSIDNISVKEVTDDTNLPRINYEGFTYENGLPVPYSGKGHLLLEGQRSNLLPYSEDFTQWSASGNMDVPILVSEISPSGESQCGFININNAASSTKFNYLAFSTTSNIHTQSLFIKYHSRQWFQFASGGTAYYANFDIQNGVIGSVSACTATIEDYGNGWYKCSITTTSAVTPTNYAIVAIDSDIASRLPNTTGLGSYYVWGAQMEVGDYVSSYIPTNGTAVTRLGETCNNATHSFPSEGVLYAEIAALADDLTFRAITISDGTLDNRVTIRYRTTSNQINVIIEGSNVIAFNDNYTSNDITEFAKVALKYKSGDIALWVNGQEVLTNTSTFTITGLDTLTFDRADGVDDFYGKTKMVATFTYLSNDEMECLTGEGYGTFEALAAAYSYTIK